MKNEHYISKTTGKSKLLKSGRGKIGPKAGFVDRLEAFGARLGRLGFWGIPYNVVVKFCHIVSPP